MWLMNLCWIFAVFGIFQTIHSASLRCYRSSLDDYDVAPLASAESLLNSSCYNKSLLNIFYTFGYTGLTNGPATTAVLTAFLKLNEMKYIRNVFLLDWQQEASNPLNALGTYGLQISYVLYAVPNSLMVSTEFGETLCRMSDNGLDLNRTYLIAHSLGAHLFGNSGRYLISKGKLVDRITGLDSARPVFDDPRILSPLGSDCARFVFTIHTSPGSYGINSSDSHVDIYVNFGNFIKPTDSHLQPGCPTGKYPMFSKEDLCSHNFSWMLFVEALFNNRTLQASKAANYYEWEAIGTSTQIVYIGENLDTTARGTFFMSTNNQSLYGKGSDGLHP